MDSNSCDVAVIGGGPAGAVAATTLARAGCDVVLVEATRYDRQRVGETLPPAAVSVLRQLGLDGVLSEEARIPSFGNCSAWTGPDLEIKSFLFDPRGNGWHVDRNRFDASLLHGAAEAGVRAHQGVRVLDIEWMGGSWRLRLGGECGDWRLDTAAVIDATGRRAVIATRLGARREIRDRLVGVTTYYDRCCREAGHTLVETMPDGWWYSAPVSANRMVVMLMTDSDICRRGRFADGDAWNRQLDETVHTQARVRNAGQTTARRSIMSAASHRLRRLDWGRPWLAVGDAAIGVDPLSSSGILRGLLTGHAGALALAHWVLGRVKPAHDYELWLDAEFERYWDERRSFYALATRWEDHPFWSRRHDQSMAPVARLH